MAILTQYGTIFGHLPHTLGRLFFVAPSASYTVNGRTYTASDANSGLRPEKALLTLSQAVTLATANVGDVIGLLPGTHTVTASVALSKAGLTIMGLPYFPDPRVDRGAGTVPQVILTTSATDEIANITAADIALINLRIRPITAATAIDFTTAADRLLVRDCVVDMKTPAGHASTRGIAATGATQAPDSVKIQNCTFIEDNAGTSQGVAVEFAAATNLVMERCTIFKEYAASSAAWAIAVQFQDNCTGIVRDNDVMAAGGAAGDAITKGFNGVTHTLAAALLCARNYKGVNVTLLFDDWAGADVDLANNYTATVAGGTGGTLITATT